MPDPIYVFATSFIVFQLAGYFLYNKELVWVATDYLWLIVAASAVVFYATKAKQFETEQTLKDTGGTYEMDQRIAKLYFSTNVFTYNLLGIGYINSSGSLHQRIKKSDEDAILAKRLEGLHDALKNMEWRDFIKQYPSEGISKELKDPELKDYASELDKIVSTAKKNQDKREALEKVVANNDMRWKELYIYPLALAIALSIRLGRTTADFRRKWKANKSSSSPSTNDKGPGSADEHSPPETRADSERQLHR
ncbi:hypothetical protein [Pseudomonas oryzihabitans]|uniref:hypothetical protein n=1 Tax=Pseudomonas oryzihabitans TaxID=47885 RepID=UPI000A89A53B|nr:hypothetical protein [Pseudomonas oryzihabitans]